MQHPSTALQWSDPAEGLSRADWLGSSSAEKALGLMVNSRMNRSQPVCPGRNRGQEHSGLCNSGTVRRLREVIILLYSALITSYLDTVKSIGSPIQERASTRWRELSRGHQDTWGLEYLQCKK